MPVEPSQKSAEAIRKAPRAAHRRTPDVQTKILLTPGQSQRGSRTASRPVKAPPPPARLGSAQVREYDVRT